MVEIDGVKQTTPFYIVAYLDVHKSNKDVFQYVRVKKNDDKSLSASLSTNPDGTGQAPAFLPQMEAYIAQLSKSEVKRLNKSKLTAENKEVSVDLVFNHTSLTFTTIQSKLSDYRVSDN
jgi:hypothetical protein